MSHHKEQEIDFNEDLNAKLNVHEKLDRKLNEDLNTKLNKKLEEKFETLYKLRNLGPTGKFPQGQLDPNDDGEVRFSIGRSKDNKKVMINFGKAVKWVGMDRNQALEVTKAILKVVKRLRK